MENVMPETNFSAEDHDRLVRVETDASHIREDVTTLKIVDNDLKESLTKLSQIVTEQAYTVKQLIGSVDRLQADTKSALDEHQRIQDHAREISDFKKFTAKMEIMYEDFRKFKTLSNALIWLFGSPTAIYFAVQLLQLVQKAPIK